MIIQARGDLLAADADALVNPVNTAGAMGKGLALLFKRAHPDNFAAYAAACRAGELRPGHVHVHDRGATAAPRWIVNFPTKRHWRSPSRPDDIRAGLQDLRRVLTERRIRSVAVPALGCGLGGLARDDVLAMIVAALGDLPDVEVRLYAPHEPLPHEPLAHEPPAAGATPLGPRRKDSGNAG